MDFQRLLLLVIFFMSGLFLLQAWQKENAPPAPPPAVQDKKAEPAAASGGSVPTTPAAPASAADASAAKTAAQASGSVPPSGVPAAAAGQTITVVTDLAEYKINTLGGVIEEAALKQHRDAADKAKPYLSLLRKDGRIHIVQTGFTNPGFPNHNTLYTLDGGATRIELGASDQAELRLSAPIRDASGAEIGKSTLRYSFRRGSYVVDVTHEITNTTQAPLSPTAYFHLHRDNKVTGEANALVGIFHGPAQFTEAKKYVKVSFSDIDKGKPGIVEQARDGWIGMVEHYFVNAWLPRGDVPRTFYVSRENGEIYRAGVKVALGEVAPGATAALTVPLLVGPQEQSVLKLAPGLEYVVDYGIFHAIAAPMFWLLAWFHKLVGNWGWAIVLLTVLIKLVFFPLNTAAARSMGKMKLVAPKLKEIQERYANDRQRLNQAMMELYKKEKINPLGGCLPILVQIPVFIALYWVLVGAVELRHAPWLGWVQDLSAPDPWFILPVLYAVTAWMQAKLMPPSPGMDPMQQKILQYMPVAFAVLFIWFPAGLVLYWTVSNIIQIGQQAYINRMLEREEAKRLALLKR
ncbi:MAG: membrane protein insertase YidC [Casimicrobiaceae bacterium]|nr:membrane protein insertase YidC [Casimicrobiaceae bacterium]MCX8098994.1 membrane protein insertase YidC [Casimicrobiaceae bacterium]MDW8311478.1 membrane protein insertase YidC [Burkholderiales bacterium]